MSRATYVWCSVARAIVPKGTEVQRETGAAIHSDFADARMCDADGKMYGTKRAWERAIDRAGCAVLTQREVAAMREVKPREFRSDGPSVAASIKETLGRLGHL